MWEKQQSSCPDMSQRLHSITTPEFFSEFVYRYPDKQHETWLGAQFVNVGIDFSYPKSLQDRIFAGIANHFMDVSFPRALKLTKDIHNADQIPRFERKFNDVERFFFASAHKFLTSERPELLPQHELVAHAELFLLRSLSSFRASRYLINLGFFSEPLTILRSALEQLAWCDSVGVRLDERQFKNPQPSKCLATFKQRLSGAGQLYGILSDYSHMEFEAQKHFVTLDEKRPGVMQQSTEFKFFGLIVYALLIIAFQMVCRDIVNFYKKNYDRHYRISNAVLPLRYLIAYALMRPELDNDEIAARLSEVYFCVFKPQTAASETRTQT
jgi:hypothetical protein